jgi:hypothetical protein
VKGFFFTGLSYGIEKAESYSVGKVPRGKAEDVFFQNVTFLAKYCRQNLPPLRWKTMFFSENFEGSMVFLW